MEHKKSGIENIKVLFGDFLDEVNNSQSQMLDKIEALEEQMVLLQEEVIRYQAKVKELEQLLVPRPKPLHPPHLSVTQENPDIPVIPDIPATSADPGTSADPETSEASENPTIPAIPADPEGRADAPGDLFSQPEVQPEVLPIPESVLEPVLEPVLQPKVQPVSQPEVVREPRPAVATEGGDRRIILEAVRPDWYDWEVDYPASPLENIAEGIGFNDRILFMKELFEGDEALFKSVVMRLNEMELFSDAVSYLRSGFPGWDEQSDEVYRFYMNVRRKLRK